MISVNGKPINVTIFPDKTSQVWKLDLDYIASSSMDGTINIEWIFESEAELFHLIQLKALLDSQFNNVKQCLFLPYLPYGRQDKLIQNHNTFALRPFLEIIKSLDFFFVVVTDPHNPNICQEILGSYFAQSYKSELVKNLYNDLKSDIVFYPDAGAKNKYVSIYNLPYLWGEKQREQTTGRILSYDIVGDVSGKSVLVVDDICDGGATFIELIKKLKFGGAKEVNLFVTHGIFSKGTNILKDNGYNRIFTKDGEVGRDY